jgi:hypothetical protein
MMRTARELPITLNLAREILQKNQMTSMDSSEKTLEITMNAKKKALGRGLSALLEDTGKRAGEVEKTSSEPGWTYR